MIAPENFNNEFYDTVDGLTKDPDFQSKVRTFLWASTFVVLKETYDVNDAAATLAHKKKALLALRVQSNMSEYIERTCWALALAGLEKTDGANIFMGAIAAFISPAAEALSFASA